MEVKKRNRFILLTRHTDQELTHFLQKEAEKGWWLEKNNGNRFTFVEKNCEGKKIWPSGEEGVCTDFLLSLIHI